MGISRYGNRGAHCAQRDRVETCALLLVNVAARAEPALKFYVAQKQKETDFSG